MADTAQPTDVHQLVERLASERASSARRAIVQAFEGATEDPLVLDACLRALNDVDASVRQAAARTLCACRRSDSIIEEALREAMDRDGSRWVRLAAAVSLVSRGLPEGLPVLEEALSGQWGQKLADEAMRALGVFES